MIYTLFILAFIGWFAIGYWSILFWYKHFSPEIEINNDDREVAKTYSIFGPFLFLIGALVWLVSKIYQ